MYPGLPIYHSIDLIYRELLGYALTPRKAGAWPTNKALADSKEFTFQGKKMNESDLYFVDEFNQEFNRDLEPMKDGYPDNFYYQFVARLRKYKGMQPPQPASAATTIIIDGQFSEWQNVLPSYKDFTNDVIPRNYDGVLPGLHYTDTSGRNDIVLTRTAHDAGNLYFYVRTNNKLSSYHDKNWMLLFIDANDNKKTGWEGYDYIVNATVTDAAHTTLKRWVNGGWQLMQQVSYAVNDKEMEIKIPLLALQMKSNDLHFNFHWVDNIQKLNDINEFFVHGDSAPERRFDYQYDATAK